MPMHNGKNGAQKNGMKKKNGRKKNGNGSGLSAAQKKLPPALQKAIAAKKKKK